MINVKRKGSIGELEFAKFLRDNGIKAWRDSASGGASASKSDVNNDIDITFEVKTVKKIGLQKAWEQTLRSASKHHNEPVLAIHFDGMPKDRWLIVLDNYYWMEMLKKKLDVLRLQSSD